MAVTTGFQGRTFDVPRTGVPCIDLPSRAPCAAADAVFADAKAFLSSSEARQMSESELERELHRRRQDLVRKLLQGHRDQRSPKEAAGPAEDTSGVEWLDRGQYPADGLHRLDAALNLLPERYLVEMRRRVTIATASRAPPRTPWKPQWYSTSSTDRLARRFAHVEMTLFDDADYVAAQYPPPAAGIPTNVRLAFRQADGYAAAAKLDRADLVFLDPPYHPNDVKDWERLGRTCRALASQRVAFAAWYPFFCPTRPQKLVDFTECEAWEVAWAPCGSRQSLKGCGMLVSDELAVHLRRIEEDIRDVAACMNSDMSTRRPAAT